MRGVEIKDILPSKIEAEKRISDYCGNNINSPLPFNRVYRSLFSVKEIAKYFIDRFIKKASLKGTKYPMVRSYSDIFIVSKETMSQFIQYCGAFAATDLFVEIAIPTALVLSATEIREQKDLELRGRALWTEDDCKILSVYDFNLKSLLENFPNTYIYLHPVKLSKWNTREI